MNKNEITFFSKVAGLAEVFPIQPATKFIPQWMKTAQSHYKSIKKETEFTRINHIARCPGIVDLMTTGYVITSWHDVIIETDPSKGSNFTWTIPNTGLFEVSESNKLLDGQNHPGILEFIPRHGKSDIIVKVNTPWHIITPKDVKVLMLPIAYPDEDIFEATPGILDPKISTEVNIQMWWNIRKGSYMIKAGTPLAHLIPLTERKLNLVVRDMNNWDSLWLKKRKFFTAFTFNPVQNKKIEGAAYENHFL